jgi:hypothetical protein
MGILAIALFTGGCGGIGKDSPGVTVSATITPTYNGSNSSSVDVVRNVCLSTNSTQTQPEFFADHGATALISASLINPSSAINQMTVYIDRYTLDYQSNADSPGAPPIQPDTREMTFSFIVSGATTTQVSVPVSFVDLTRKSKYYSDVTTGGFASQTSYLINKYTATYTFEGHSENGVPITFSAQKDFQIGSFDNCPDGFY